MGFLSKEDYEKRNESAARRMLQNKENQNLTEEQHEALANLCKVRHEFHSNLDSISKRDQDEVKQDLVSANQHLKETGLEFMDFIPTEEEDFIDIDDMYLLAEIDEMDSEEEGYEEWYESNHSRIYKELENLNAKIENYLSKIDKKYGTNYAPTGSLRIF